MMRLSTVPSEEVARYHASPNGNADGHSESEPAMYTSPALWEEVALALEHTDVVVSFSPGTYRDELLLREVGDEDHRLVLEGSTAAGTVFEIQRDAHRSGRGIAIMDSRNITLRQLHFTESTEVADESDQAAWAVVIFDEDKSGDLTRPPESDISWGITIDSCTFRELSHVYYGAVGVLDGSSDILITNNDFEHVGVDSHAHMIYASHFIDGIVVHANTFSNCSGEYVRFRHENSAVEVTNNLFFETADYASAYPAFVTLAVFNPGSPDYENIFGPDTSPYDFHYKISGNRFVFRDAAPQHQFGLAMRFLGSNPVGELNYLFTLGEADTLQQYGNSSDPTPARALLGPGRWNIRPDTFDLGNNCCTNCDQKFALESGPYCGWAARESENNPCSSEELELWNAEASHGNFESADVYGAVNYGNQPDMYPCPSSSSRAVVWGHHGHGNGFAHRSTYDRMAGFDPNQKWLSGDFDGDGRDDLAMIEGVWDDDQGREVALVTTYLAVDSRFEYQSWHQRLAGFWDEQQWLGGDVDGDGKDDLVNVYGVVVDGVVRAAAWAHHSTGTGFEFMSSHDTMAQFWTGQKWQMGDFDGDGKHDLVNIHGINVNGTHRAVAWGHHSTGDGFEYMSSYDRFAQFWDEQQWQVGDFDADGKDDLVNVYGVVVDGEVTAALWTHHSTGAGFEQRSSYDRMARFWDEQRWRTGDFDGDGSDDLANAYGARLDSEIRATVWGHRSTGSGFEYMSSHDRMAGFWADQKWIAGDFDGDGIDDLVNVYGIPW